MAKTKASDKQSAAIATALVKSHVFWRDILHGISSWEQEALREKDPRLTYERIEFRDLLSGRRHLIIGRKGAGKTAVVRFVERSVEGYQAGAKLHPSFDTSEPRKPIFVRLDARQLDLLELAPLAGNPAQAAAFWQELFYDAILRKLAFDADPTNRGRGAFMYLIHEAFNLLAKSDVTVKLMGLELKKTRDMSWQQRAAASRQFLCQATSTYPRGCKIFVAIDQLDHSFLASMTELDRKTYLSLITGLLAAASAVRDLDDAYFGGHIQLIPIIAVRTDILRLIQHPDLNKWTDDSGVNLRWAPTETKAMLAHRLSVSTGLSPDDFFGNWTSVFEPSKLKDEYDNRNEKEMFDFIELRTMWAPRDYIVFLRGVSKFAASNNEPRVGIPRLVLSEGAYSEYVRAQLLNEGSSHLPDLDDILTKIQLMVQRDVRKRNFALSDFVTCLSSTESDAAQMLRKLYSLSIVGNSVEGRKGNSRYAFAHRQERFGVLDPTATIVIHPAIHRSMH